MWMLWTITEGLFWLLALLALAPMVACQWVIGKGVGSSAVFTQFLGDLAHFRQGRHGTRRTPAVEAAHRVSRRHTK